MAAPSQLALLRAVEVLNLHTQDLRLDRGYLDLVGDHERSPTGVAQRLMHSQVVPIVYQRWWRPAIGRVLKGPKGPSMAQEQRLARQLLAAKQDATVLDIACGPGNFTRRLATDVGKRGAVIGIDISPTMLTRAVNDTDVTQVVYVRADISNLSIRADSVDAVCCFAALHLFPDPWAALDVIARALVPSGRLAILTTVRPKRSFGALATNAFARVGGVRSSGPASSPASWPIGDLRSSTTVPSGLSRSSARADRRLSNKQAKKLLSVSPGHPTSPDTAYLYPARVWLPVRAALLTAVVSPGGHRSLRLATGAAVLVSRSSLGTITTSWSAMTRWPHLRRPTPESLKEQLVILIVLKVQIRPDRRDDWLAGIQRYTDAVRQEQGNLSFECFESIQTPNEFVVVEGFASREAGDAHVQTDHFKDFMVWFPGVVAAAPKIVNVETPGWSEMAELG